MQHHFPPLLKSLAKVHAKAIWFLNLKPVFPIFLLFLLGAVARNAYKLVVYGSASDSIYLIYFAAFNLHHFPLFKSILNKLYPILKKIFPVCHKVQHHSLSPWAAVGLSAAMGLWFAYFVFGFDFFPQFFRQYNAREHDPQVVINSARLFLNQKWDFPLAMLSDWNGQKLSLLFADSNPVMAVIWKGFYTLGWVSETYWGAWFHLIYFMQAFVGGLLLYKLRVRSPLVLILGILIFSFSGEFFKRFHHFSLGAHCFILLGLLLYVMAHQAKKPHMPLLWFALLNAVVFSTHGYLFVMTFMLFVACLIHLCYEQKKLRWYQVIGYGCVNLVAIYALAWLLGTDQVLTSNIRLTGGAFGWPIGVLAPITTLLPSPVGEVASPGFFGYGIVFLLITHLLYSRTHIAALIKTHKALFVITLLLAIWAVSDHFYLGKWPLLPSGYRALIPGPLLDLLGIFRSPGRFMWMAQYLLIASLIVLTVRRVPITKATLLLTFVFLVQYENFSVRMEKIRYRFSDSSPALAISHSIDDKTWQRVFRQHDELKAYPTYPCTSSGKGTRLQLRLNYMLAFSGHTKTTGYYTGRWPAVDCKKEFEGTLTSPKKETALYVYIKPHYTRQDVRRIFAQTDQHCAVLDEGYVCSARPNLLKKLGFPPWVGG